MFLLLRLPCCSLSKDLELVVFPELAQVHLSLRGISLGILCAAAVNQGFRF